MITIVFSTIISKFKSIKLIHHYFIILSQVFLVNNYKMSLQVKKMEFEKLNWFGKIYLVSTTLLVFLLFFFFFFTTQRCTETMQLCTLTWRCSNVSVPLYIFYCTSHVGFFPSQCQVGWYVRTSHLNLDERKKISSRDKTPIIL